MRGATALCYLMCKCKSNHKLSYCQHKLANHSYGREKKEFFGFSASSDKEMVWHRTFKKSPTEIDFFLSSQFIEPLVSPKSSDRESSFHICSPECAFYTFLAANSAVGIFVPLIIVATL